MVPELWQQDFQLGRMAGGACPVNEISQVGCKDVTKGIYP
jgi:hypothetical protein